jgi:hypothetical protein
MPLQPILDALMALAALSLAAVLGLLLARWSH